MVEVDKKPALQLNLHLYPSKYLKSKCFPVDSSRFNTPELIELVQEMKVACQRLQGQGLSANQVGYLDRLFVMCVDEKEQKYQEFINPDIMEYRGKIIPSMEACLSIPGVLAKLHTRNDLILVKYQDIKGDAHTSSLEGYKATVFQHENSHLKGKTIFDEMGIAQRTLKLNSYLKKYKRLKRNTKLRQSKKEK